MVVAAAIIQLCLFKWRNHTFFRSGLLLYRSRHSMHGRSASALNVAELERQCESWWGPTIRFRRFAVDEFGFREEPLGGLVFRYVPIMHGHIWVEDGAEVLVVDGRLDWFPLALMLVLAASAVATMKPFLFVAPALVIAGQYIIQVLRYKALCTHISAALDQQWCAPRTTR